MKEIMTDIALDNYEEKLKSIIAKKYVKYLISCDY